MIVKTPGVYIKETNNLAPTIVEVSTAIPVFIGFTGRAQTDPVFISNMMEFTNAFGGAYPTKYTVDMNASEIVSPDRNFYLYDSVDLYFKNGGGPCYIISAGTYATLTSDFVDYLEAAIVTIENVGEATIVVVPDLHVKHDGTSIGPADYGSLSSGVLNVCGTEKDKFALFDYHTTLSDSQAIRTLISPLSDNLKYGALYYPWLKNGKNFNVSFENLVTPPVSSIPTTNVVGSKMLTESIAQINLELGYLETRTSLTEISVTSLNETYEGLLGLYNVATTTPNKKAALRDIFKFLHNLVQQLETAEGDVSGNDANSSFLASFNQLKNNPSFIAEVQKLIRFVHLLRTLNAGSTSDKYVHSAASNWNEPTDPWVSNTAGESYSDVEGITTFINPSDFVDPHAQPAANKSRDQILSDFDAGIYVNYQLIFASVASLADGHIQTQQQLERRLFTEDQAYIDIQNAIDENMKQIPSQGAVAGIYCTNDRDRGVWKSPANMAIQGIEKPLVEVSNRQQDDLNVDSIAGKSINVIRTFTGKGPLIWGARTLAGNDNEWRYISVRRFFNFAEESIGISLRDFLFEPNNELTWVKIKAMITSFLVNQWQLGALTGGTMSEAFFVNVGEDTTSPADINNGIINIQVGLAVARPAEFIVIEFSHHLKA